MLHFAPCFALKDAGGCQGCLISASPSGVSERLRTIQLCINKNTRHERVYKLDPALKKPRWEKINTLICWNGIYLSISSWPLWGG